MATSQSQANKVYAEVVTDGGLTAKAQVQKIYIEVVNGSDLTAYARAKKLYIEVITDLPAVGGAAAAPVIMVMT